MDQLNDLARLELPSHEDYETVAGLILDRVKRIPQAGERVVVDGVTLIVTKATERSIEEVEVEVIGGRRRGGGKGREGADG